MPTVRILVAEERAAGSFVAPDGAQENVPRFCRVAGEASPTAGSLIGFELWLPAVNWNGRYYQLGNGGFAGNISYPALTNELRAGNAAATTDTGHRGHGFDASWAQGHPKRIIDYGYRSHQVTAEVAQALVRSYYGAPPRYRYFAGCSNGGRQAFMEAQRNPQQWDGILAGAPAIEWTNQLTAFASIQHALRSDPAAWISPSKLPAIQRAALSSCTADAAMVAGMPGDPRACPFNAEVLLCRGEENDECLTRTQLASLRAIIGESEVGGSRSHGRFSFPGFEPTTAAAPDNWQRWILNKDRGAPSQLTFAEQFYRHLVFGRPQWTIETFDPARDPAVARRARAGDELLPGVLDATSSDLQAFERQGRKLLMYFGWADAVIAPRSGVQYYERVSRRLGGFERTRRFFRLFMVPGMAHCQHGPGPSAFGQAPIAPALGDDARHSIRRALEKWVEEGIAPESLIAAKYVNDRPEQGLAATQLLCPFPRHAERVDSDPRRASNYKCVDRREGS